MAYKPDFCLGCCQFVDGLTVYHILPERHFPVLWTQHPFPLCCKCADELEKLVLNKELQNGGWEDKLTKLEIPIYFLLLSNFIMGEV